MVLCEEQSFTLFFAAAGPLLDSHSFPTRRSSDLGRRLDVSVEGAAAAGGVPCCRVRGRAGGGAAAVPAGADALLAHPARRIADRKSTRLNSSHLVISYAVFCLKKKKK